MKTFDELWNEEHREANKRILDYIKKNGGKVYIIDLLGLWFVSKVRIVEIDLESFYLIREGGFFDICLKSRESKEIETGLDMIFFSYEEALKSAKKWKYEVVE